MAQVTSFAVTDSVANVDSGLAGLIGDSKLASLTVEGTAGADSLVLTGLRVATTIDMGGDGDRATLRGFVATGPGSGMAAAISLGSGYDTIALGSGADTILYALGAAGGVEVVTAFNAAHDLLSITLNGGSLEQTLVAGGDWISSSSDLAHGVFLAGVTSLQKATVSGGIAIVA